MRATAPFHVNGKSYSPADSDPVGLCLEAGFVARGSKRTVGTTIRREVFQTAWGELFGYALVTVQTTGETRILINEWMKLFSDELSPKAWLEEQRSVVEQLIGPINHIVL